MRKIKRMTAALLVAAMVFSATVQAAAPRFPDVPANHWAYSFVEKAAEKGWIAGYPDGRFGVDDQLSYAAFATMLVRAFCPEELDAYTGPDTPWYAPYCGAANQAGLFDGTNAEGKYQNDATVNQSVSRYEMAQMLYNVLMANDVTLTYDAASVQAGIGDWSSVPAKYQNAVTATNAAGIISGVDSNGTFSGNTFMTRGQAAVVMCRVDEVIEAGEVVVQPDPTPDPTPAAGTLKNGKPATVENVLEMLAEIEEEWPTGTVWAGEYNGTAAETEAIPGNHWNTNTVSPTLRALFAVNKHHASTKYGCSGFAAMVSDLIFPAEMECREVTDVTQVRPGDIIIRLDKSTGETKHVMVAVNTIQYGNNGNPWTNVADGNNGDQIVWPSEDFSNFCLLADDGTVVIYTRYPN